MRRVIIMGPPGSGKSTLARRLGSLHDLPVFHLDHAFWRPGWSPAPPKEFLAEVERIAVLPAWVTDGNYGAALAPRLARADTVVFLDLPPCVYLPRVLRRTLVGAVIGRTQAPGCREWLDAAFLRYAFRMATGTARPRPRPAGRVQGNVARPEDRRRRKARDRQAWADGKAAIHGPAS